MRIVLLDTATLGEDVDLSPITSIGEATVYKNTSPEEVAERLRDAEVAVLNKIKLTKAPIISALLKPKVYCSFDFFNPIL